MLKAAKLGWMLAAVVVCLYVSQAASDDVRPRQIGDELHSFEAKPYQMVEDFGNEPPYDARAQYYYYIPCPTYSWFWGYSGWEPGDVLGAYFRFYDTFTGGCDPFDIYGCWGLEWIRVLDFAGYGVQYPGLFTIELDVYCSDESESPFHHLWNSGPLETAFGWNYFYVNPMVSLDPCTEHNRIYSGLTVTMTFTGTEGQYPAVGFDNVGTAVETGCVMHDIGCLPAFRPRGYLGGSDPRVHSGYVGSYAFEYWPPLALPDGMHVGGGPPVPYGCVEAAWRIYVLCGGPNMAPVTADPTSWSGIKSLYK